MLVHLQFLAYVCNCIIIYTMNTDNRVSELREFYSNKPVTVIGGAGFVGSHLVDALLGLGADVLIVDNMSRGKYVRTDEGLSHKVVDISDPDVARSNVKGSFAVFNLAAAVAGVIHNQSHHLQMFDDNIRVATAPVRAAEYYRVPHYLQVSSVCVYAPGLNRGSIEQRGHDGEPVAANSGYSWAKRMAERAVLWSDLEHGVIVRPSNIFGPRDYFDERSHVIPALIKKFAVDVDFVELYGSGAQVREFIYVTDVVAGMLYALAFGENREAYNIGTHGETTTTIHGLARKIRDMSGSAARIDTTPENDGGDDMRWSNAQKLRALGWTHKWGLDEGLKRTIDWYYEVLHK